MTTVTHHACLVCIGALAALGIVAATSLSWLIWLQLIPSASMAWLGAWLMTQDRSPLLLWLVATMLAMAIIVKGLAAL